MTSKFTKKKIHSNHTLADKLTKARKRLGVDLRTAETETKVAMRHLVAMEKGNFSGLPEPVYVRGFLTRYAAYLGLKAEAVIDQFDQEWTAFRQVSLTNSIDKSNEELIRPHVRDEWLKQPNRFSITPQLLWGSMLSVMVLGLATYIWFQVASFAAAPPLEIQSPATSSTVSVESVVVTGATDSNSQIYINGQQVAVDTSGHFNQEVSLMDGVNTITISARNKADKETTKVIQLLAEDNQKAGPQKPTSTQTNN